MMALTEEQVSEYLHGYGVGDSSGSLDRKRRLLGEIVGLTVQTNNLSNSTG